jgi:hypothetical protein
LDKKEVACVKFRDREKELEIFEKSYSRSGALILLLSAGEPLNMLPRDPFGSNKGTLGMF